MPFRPPEDLSGPGIEPASLVLAGEFFTSVLRGKPCILDSQQLSLAHSLTDASHYDFFVARSYWSLTLEGESHSIVSDSLLTPWTIQSMEFSRQEYWSGVSFPFSRDLSDPGMEPRSPALQADSLPAEPPGKPKNTGVGSLPLLQGIFLTQELNWGLLLCR